MDMRRVLAALALGALGLGACSDAGDTGSPPRAASIGPLEPPVAFSYGAGCSTFRLSESAVYDDANGTFNTVGIAVIGSEPPLAFTSVVYTLDADWDRLFEGKNFKAFQREEFTFENGDELYVEGPAMSVPLSAPGMYEVYGGGGKFVGGTGGFAGAHGSAAVRGVTMFAPGVAETSIAWYNGELCLSE